MTVWEARIFAGVVMTGKGYMYYDAGKARVGILEGVVLVVGCPVIALG